MTFNFQLDVALPRLHASGKRQVFETLVNAVYPAVGYTPRILADRLMQEESLGGLGVGDGVAIAHLKMERIPRRFVALTTLSRPLAFKSSVDERPVDLVCLLLSPESHGGLHLRGLSRISRLLKNESFCQRLREARDAETLRGLFMNPEGWLLAA